MAVITSSSVTSSAVPTNDVLRRSSRMARSLSALPRSALMSWRRSVSFRGRKSMDVLPSVKKAKRKSRWLARGRQLCQNEVNAAIHLGFLHVNLQQVTVADQVVAHLFVLQDQSQL